MEATLDKSGRIVIPKQIRDDLGLSPGSVLRVERETLVVKDGVLIFTGELDEDIEQAVQRDRELRSRKLAGLA